MEIALFEDRKSALAIGHEESGKEEREEGALGDGNWHGKKINYQKANTVNCKSRESEKRRTFFGQALI